jgi:hypothetical protein
MNSISSVICIKEKRKHFSTGAGTLFGGAMRRFTRYVPKPVRALLLLTATIVFFPVIVGLIVLELIVVDLPGVPSLLGPQGEGLDDNSSRSSVAIVRSPEALQH